MAWKRKNCNGKDFISSLPDEILVILLSELRVTEAARTSILSSRWRNLWTLLTGTLDIDGSDFMSPHKLEDSKQRLRNSMFYKTVNQILWQHQGLTIDKFRICSPKSLWECYLDHCKVSNHFLDGWIEKQVKHLELDLEAAMTYPPVPSARKRRFPAPVRSPGSTSFVSLVSLHLISAQISDQVVHNFLCNSPLLEELLIVKARCLLECLIICGPLKLKRLDLIHSHIGVLEISAPNLVTFNYQGMEGMIDLYLENIPLVTRLSFSEELMADIRYDYPHLVPQLEELSLTFPKHWFMSPGIPHFPVLENLKQLQLSLGRDMEAGLSFFFKLMEASPSLHRLSLDLGWRHCPTPKPEFTDESPKHECLKVVEIFCFTWCSNEVDLVKCIAQYASSLEKIMIHCSHEKSVVLFKSCNQAYFSWNWRYTSLCYFYKGFCLLFYISCF